MKTAFSTLADFGRFCLVVTMCSALAAAMVLTANKGSTEPQAERSAAPTITDPPLSGLSSQSLYRLDYRYNDEVGQ
jgi:hypothetical protein